MEPPEEKEPDRAEGLVRVTELEDEITALAVKHRQLRVGFFGVLAIAIATDIALLSGAQDLTWFLVGQFLLLPWFVLATQARMKSITKSKEDLLLQLDEVKQPGRIHARPSREGDTE